MSEKICNCAEGPRITQSIPAGFKGSLICGKCGGKSEFPRPEKRYQGNDAVEGYLFEVKKNTNGLTFETAVLETLLRIEKALKQRGNGGR